MLSEIISVIIGIIIGYLLCKIIMERKYKKDLLSITNDVTNLNMSFKVSSEIEKRAIDIYDTGMLYINIIKDYERGFKCLIEAGLLFKGAKEILLETCNNRGKNEKPK